MKLPRILRRRVVVEPVQLDGEPAPYTWHVCPRCGHRAPRSHSPDGRGWTCQP